MEFNPNNDGDLLLNISALKVIKDYYENYMFDSKKEEILLIEDIINTKKGDYYKYLRDFEIAKEMNKRIDIIKYLYDYEKRDTENKMKYVVKKWENIEKLIRNKKILNIEYSYDYILGKYFNNNDNEELLFKIFNKDSIEFFRNNNAYIKEMKYKLEEILKYYKEFFSEVKMDDILYIEELLQNNKGNYEKYLNDYQVAIEMKHQPQEIKEIFKKIAKKEDKYNNITRYIFLIQKCIRDKKINKLRRDIIDTISYFFFDNNNEEICLKLFNKDEIDFFKEYFIKNRFQKLKEKLKEKLNYYRQYLFDSKKEDILSIEEYYKNKNYKVLFNGLNRDEIKMNKRIDIINFLFYSKTNRIIKTEKEFQKIVKVWEDIEFNLENKYFNNILNEDKILLNLYFKKNKKIFQKIYLYEEMEYLEKEFNKDIVVQDNKNFINNLSSSDKNIINDNNFVILNKPDEQEDINSIIENILNLSFIYFIFEQRNKKIKDPYFNYYEINLGKNNTKVNLNKLKETIDNNKYKLDKNLVLNFKKFLNFLEEFKENINKEFKYEYNLDIKLEFQREKENNEDFIYNIFCIYNFYEPIKYENLKFKEENILINGIKSKSEGFKYLLKEINNVKFKIY